MRDLLFLDHFGKREFLIFYFPFNNKIPLCIVFQEEGQQRAAKRGSWPVPKAFEPTTFPSKRRDPNHLVTAGPKESETRYGQECNPILSSI